ncbi:hypothetical protein ACFL6C_04295 [Myxococcota bacterium]
MTEEQSAAEELWRKEVAGLAVDEILALCYAFQHKLERLRLYLDVLRRRGGQRAQFASCLICFDLARQGEASFQQEFTILADTMRQLACDEQFVTGLMGDDPYLEFLWELCQAQLAEIDPRFEPSLLPEPVEEVASVDLFSEADFAEFEDLAIGVDDSELWLRFDQAVEDFLGGEVGVPVYDPESGFRVKSTRDVERVERFVLELDSLRDFIPMARGFRALVLLFYGTHMRSKSLFGVINKRKQSLLREGLREFINAGQQLWEVAGVLSSLHTTDDVWDKISDIIIDYLQWIRMAPDEARGGPESYDAVGRLVSRQPLIGNRRTTRRD